VNFGCESANLLGTGDAHKERNQRDGRRHLDDNCCFNALSLRSYALGSPT
jgi:hypothetical protein